MHDFYFHLLEIIFIDTALKSARLFVQYAKKERPRKLGHSN